MLRVYIETTVWSFAFADDSPDYTAHVLQFFDECRSRRIAPVASAVVLKEMARSEPEMRDKLLALFREIAPEVIETEPPIEDLADAFIKMGAAPPSKPDDALHVAAAIVSQCDVLVSLNFKHIASIRRAERFNAVAVLRGYSHPLRIVSPAEVLYGDETP